MKLYLKGERCHSEKCAIEKRNFVPGQHGQARKAKIVGYGLQLREKQKVRRIYGVLERQFRSGFEKAALQKGITGDNMMANLERRLDSVIYRIGFGTSRSQARQIVRHGHIQVNGHKVDVPSYICKPGDEVGIREGSRDTEYAQALQPMLTRKEIAGWMELNAGTMMGRVARVPSRDELDLNINEQLIVEYYSR